MKRLLLIAALLLPFCRPAIAADLTVFAGAGLRDAVQTVIIAYEKQTGDKVLVEYGGSGQLVARIRESGKGDVFIPGSMVYVDGLEKDGLIVAKAGLALHGAVLAVHRSAADRIKAFDDLTKPGLRLGLGDPQAMALGRTAEEILDRSGKRKEIEANVTVRAATVKQLALYVANGDVDAAIIGGPDIAKNADSLVARLIPTTLYQPEIAGYAVLKGAANPAGAQVFAALLSSDLGRKAFADAGFPPVP